jgi:thiol-disulfide isomerase/thioredoxin
MRQAVLCFLLAGFMMIPSARAQSGDSGIGKSDNGSGKPKAHRVWDNESIQQIQGGISVVGNTPAGKPGAAADPKKPQVVRAPGTFFKATTIDGDVISSDSLSGKTVLVQYWATWCPHCQADQAAVDRIARSFGSQGVAVLAVDVDESDKVVKKYLSSNPRQVPIILEKDSNLGSLTTVKGYPTYIVIDPNGRVVARASGEVGDQGLRKLLSRAGIKAD